MKRLYDFTFTMKMGDKAWARYAREAEGSVGRDVPTLLDELGWIIEDFLADLDIKAKFVKADQSRNEDDFDKEFGRPF